MIKYVSPKMSITDNDTLGTVGYLPWPAGQRSISIHRTIQRLAIVHTLATIVIPSQNIKYVDVYFGCYFIVASGPASFELKLKCHQNIRISD